VTPETAAEIGRMLNKYPEFADQTIRYLIQTCKELKMKSIDAFTKEAFPDAAEHYQSHYAREMIAKGHQEGQGALLLRMVQHRFGDLPAWVPEKINRANLADLERWSLRFVTAKSLEDIF